jgi:hypothetical protein
MIQMELPGLLKFRPLLEREGGRLVLVSVDNPAFKERIRALLQLPGHPG